ncbi:MULTISPECIES: TonB-dependent receptor [Sphingobium]|uniref:TonB-dependent receptor n=1 Tax=Sphingobium TaxID=165695 RepID=UPI00159C4E96|nr:MULTISPECIES: TonB-dependent receptor [unclassified Sphingobium]
MNIITRSGLLASAAVVFTVSAPPAWAQAADASSAEASAESTSDIIVTANKRNENINKVGASIAAFDTSLLEKRNIGKAEDLVKYVPGMALAPSTHGTPVYTLRGIGYNADALGVYPAVSISMDQAPLTFPVLAGHSLYDLERVEVLKGPQGTLFGQNSTGGAINYVAAKPTKDLQAGFNLDYGRFNEIHGSGYISGPISDTVQMRLAFDAKHRDAWQYNFLDPSQKNGTENYFAGRLITAWQASDRLKFALNINGSVDRSQPQALQLIASLPSTTSAPTFAELNAALAPQNLRAASWSTVARTPGPLTGGLPFPLNPAPGYTPGFQSITKPAVPTGDRNLFQATLRADLDLSDSIAITSITGFSRLTQNMSFDLDGSPYQFVDNPRDEGKISDFSQELRISNAAAPGQQFRWTVGGNYNHSKVVESQDIPFGDNGVSNAAVAWAHISTIDSRGKMDNVAAFANGEFDLTDQITLKGGIRYTHSVNHERLCNSDTTPDQRASVAFGLGINNPGACFTLFPDFSNGKPYLDRLSEDNVSWKVGIDFKPTRDLLFYANVSRGFKAGSFPVLTATTTDTFRPAKQEQVTSYEGGFKAKFLGNVVQWTGAIFYQDYRDKQIQGTFVDVNFGLLQRLDNVPKSHIFGVETDLVVRPVSGLTLTGSASYLKTKVDEYTATTVFGNIGGPNHNQPFNFAGNRLPFAPSWSLTGDVDYRIATGNGGSVFVGGSVNYRSDVDAYIGGSILRIPGAPARSIKPYPFRIDGYTLVDARIGYDFPGDRLTISAWGKNIFNQFNVQNVISYNDIITQATGMPTTYGVSLKVRFK